MFEHARRLVEEIEAGGNERVLSLDLKACLNQLGIYPVPGNWPELFAVVGHSAARAGDIDAAKWFLARAVEQGATSAETLGHYASGLAGTGDYTQATGYAERALSLYPDSKSRSWFHELAGFVCLQQDDEAGQLKHYSLAVQEDPDNLSARYGLGRALLAAGRGPETLEQIRVLVEKDPKSKDGWHLLGQAALQAKDLTLARKALERTVALGNDTPSVLTLRVAAALLDGESVEAEQLISLAAADSSEPFDKTQLLIGVAQTLAEFGYPAEAEARFQLAVTAEPGNPKAHWALAEHLMHHRRFIDAMPSLQALVNLMPGCGSYWYELGFAAMRSGDVPLAGAALNKALKLRPEDVEVWNELSGYYSVIGQGDEALQWMSRVLEYFPDDSTAHFNLGIALFEADRLEESLVRLQQAVELKPEPRRRRLLAQVLIDLQRYADAEPILAGLSGTDEEEHAHFLWVLSRCESGDAQLALARAQDEVVARSDSPVIWAALALVAWYYGVQKLYQDSLSYAKKLGRDDSWVAWAVALTAAERP